MPHKRKRVLGVLAGANMRLPELSEWLASAEYIIAADGAADRCLEAGYAPHVTIGDLDSLQNRDIPGRIQVADQDSSDCDKLLAFAKAQGVREMTVAGIEGDRLDHVLASLSSIVASGLAVRLALVNGVGYSIGASCPLTVGTELGDLVSLLPLLPCSGVDLIGVQWPLAAAEVVPGGLVSLSNRAIGPEVTVEVQSGFALLILGGERFRTPHWP